MDPRDQQPQPHMLRYSHWPEPPEEYAELDDAQNRPLVLRPVFTGKAFSDLVQYPVIVEAWDKVAGRYAGGRRRRAYLAEFNEAERRTLSSYYSRFYRWYIVTGVPGRVMCRLSTLQLLRRAVQFFATV